MSTKILGPTGSKRRKRMLLGPILLAAALAALFVAGAARAVHDFTFQLDGDVIASTTTTVGGSSQTLDWNSLFNSAGGKLTLPTGFTASAFDRDFGVKTNGAFSTADDTTYATGSKDTLPITPGWQCSQSNNVLSKNDIMNSYSAAFTAPNGHQILYFAMERNGNNGDGNVGFWFLQNGVSCESPGGSTAFTGDHADGDLLVVSAFTGGGSVSTIDVYRWNGGANGSLGTTSVAHGVDCKTTAGSDTACATVNGPTNGVNGTITTPWLTSSTATPVGHSLQTSEFFEGGLDLTGSNLAGKCFNVFIGDTRSSQSLTATLFDYSAGALGECTSTTTTSPVDATDTSLPPASAIPGDPSDAVVTVKDKTIVDVTGINTFSGSISWHLCGPTATTSTATCDSGGVDVGSQNITAKGTYYSPTATITAAGRYCFRAEFSGDSTAGVPGSDDHSSTECFTVAPRAAALTTQATTGPVEYGLSISDTVTLSNTAHEPGTGGPTGSTLAGSINPTAFGGDASGDVTVVAYGPDSCSTVAFTSGAIAASGNGSYGGAGTAFEFTPTAPGQYVFVAAYAGDSPNTSAIAATACSAAPAAEKVTVQQIPTRISTTQKAYPQDSATIESTVAGNSLPTGGTVTFRLYGPTGSGATAKTASENCLAHGDTLNAGGLLYREIKNPVAGGNSFTVGTNNTTVSVNTNDTFYWRVTYATGDTAHTGRQSDCVENITTAFANDAFPGTLYP